MAISAQKLLGGSTESKTKNTKFLAKVSKSNLSVAKQRVSLVKETIDLVKLKNLLNSLVNSTNSLKKAAKKDSQDQSKANKDRKKKKGDVQAQKREEKTETTKIKAQVTKKLELPKAPDFFKDIMGMLGKFTLSVGVMELLRFMTDTKASDSIFGFLENHIDKIAIGFLGLMGAVFVSSFLPVISLVGTVFGLLAPVVISMASFLTNPIVIALIGSGYVAGKQKLSDQQKKVVELLEEQANSEDPFVVFSEENRNKLIERYKKEKENMGFFESQVRGKGRQIDENIKFLETGQFGYGDYKFKFNTPSPIGLDFGGNFDFNTGEARGGYTYNPGTEKTPQAQPQAQPQTPIVGDTKLGGASGDSGSAMYKGRGKKAALSTGITPFLQSDIDKQGISIISGFGKRFGRNHKGYDLAAAEGTPLHAYLPGVVVRNMSNVSGYGNLIEWKDDVYGQIHMFAHMMEPSELRSGTKFKAGAVLGKVGTTDGGTGISEGPHLHWEIGAQGSEIDPGEWLKSHPINIVPKQTPDKAQKVSSTAPYEEPGTQIALLEVPVSTPSRGVGGGGSRSSSGSSGSGGDVNTYIRDLILASHYREA